MIAVGLLAARRLPSRSVPVRCTPSRAPSVGTAGGEEFTAPQPRQRTDCRSMRKMRASWWCTSAACCPEQDASASTTSAHAGVRPNTVATCDRAGRGRGPPSGETLQAAVAGAHLSVDRQSLCLLAGSVKHLQRCCHHQRTSATHTKTNRL